MSAVTQAVICLISLLLLTDLATASTPEYLPARDFLHSDSRPSFPQPLGKHESFQNTIQKPMTRSLLKPIWYEGSKPSNTGISFASHSVRPDYLKPNRESYGQGLFERPDMWQSNMMVPVRPELVQMTVSKNNRPMLGMLKQLLNGDFHIVADAIHVDAIPIRRQPFMEGMIIVPTISPLLTNVNNQVKPVQQMYLGLPEADKQEPSISSSLSNTHSSNMAHQVPLELLLQEFNDLDAKNNLKPDGHVVTFASLYQNYIELLEQQNKRTTPPMLSTTTSTTIVTPESTAHPTTPETETTVDVISTPAIPMSPVTKKEDGGYSLIQTSQGKITDDKQVLWLPGMAPEMTGQ
ncbi:uncharacterized protein LOC110442556 [Mizuhopecten yessoensis]|uniref:Uncharacterized protein n=1 Tax=Mizuhopecten yessoensis TaxID=6573 RepID=A0A210PGX8_MIZYE|nr:uncharacterized protein LOC110442556 [Mizuhopecten yessoensis]OWF35744.1 hypothetical protein KP79_PYT10581 [Mizuhopecten yessoensis]